MVFFKNVVHYENDYEKAPCFIPKPWVKVGCYSIIKVLFSGWIHEIQSCGVLTQKIVEILSHNSVADKTEYVFIQGRIFSVTLSPSCFTVTVIVCVQQAAASSVFHLDDNWARGIWMIERIDGVEQLHLHLYWTCTHSLSPDLKEKKEGPNKSRNMSSGVRASDEM